MDVSGFSDTIGPGTKALARVTGAPASFTVAEAALESGWGSSQLACQGKNLLGVKADSSWHGDVLVLNTREFLHATWVMVPARWQKYAGWQACMDDHAAFWHQQGDRTYGPCGWSCGSSACVGLYWML
ncbi:glucosaminidase domain-containing protein [Accumulibacter sp.]|uniref:glycoside hydrolase family 73 protein n=1 Tax=Accumulibacter sp. TaxID=2053492 RepID=UPI0026141DEC|nr:glucosaminidase domain-containing protein [Accumulibacter sp.]